MTKHNQVSEKPKGAYVGGTQWCHIMQVDAINKKAKIRTWRKKVGCWSKSIRWVDLDRVSGIIFI